MLHTGLDSIIDCVDYLLNATATMTAEFIPHAKTSISKVTITLISITHKSSDLEFLAFPASIYSNSVDSNGSLHRLMPSQKQRHCH